MLRLAADMKNWTSYLPCLQIRVLRSQLNELNRMIIL
jgi:hypothetical protein